MKSLNDYSKWALNHTWIILFSYFISMIVLLFIHDAFGFSMADDGTYLSNAVMHIGSGFVLALGTGIMQRELLKKHIRISSFWVVSLIIGFVVAEITAGIVLWKLEIYRGLINIFNTDVHFPESLIFALAGLIAGIIQFRLLKPYYNNRFYWIIASAMGWALLILSTYISPFALILGAMLYGAITGLAFYRIMESKAPDENMT
ncbi:MAG TPA: hypothetical protein P5531_06985 [Bacteroidales bacterium]|nr:hypothetical protein [Bacteroidales bacterium]HSA44495.1 hypothetical protein [Bacteroidales bacterium]